MEEITDYTGPKPHLYGFLSSHESTEKVVNISAEPSPIYIEEARDSYKLNFDFTVTGLTNKKLIIKFIKAAIYDELDNLITYRHLNHNAVGTAGIHTIGKHEINGRETLDIFNPFYSFPKTITLSKLRYMFTFFDPEQKKEYYYGSNFVIPKIYNQKVKLIIPVKGMITILDGHDFYSHHRRFSMNLVRKITNNVFWSNFSRYAIDFTLLGDDGNTREMTPLEYIDNYDFHFTDVTKFYTHEADVFAPADGVVVDVVDSLEDLYDSKFNFDKSLRDNRIVDLAGNYVVIKHNEGEFSHLFHLLKDSVEVSVGDKVSVGHKIAEVGFSGASTTYSHLHYQLLDGADFLTAIPLPCKFSDVLMLNGKHANRYEIASIDTGDIMYQD
jgi:hypothetical protein